MHSKFTSFILFLFLFGNNLYAQKMDSLDMEKVYSFLNSTMTNDTIKFNLSDQSTFGMFGNDTSSIINDTMFDNLDKEYIRQQFAMLGNVTWQKGKIVGANIIPRQDINKVFKKKKGWDAFRKKYGYCLTTFSLPIFNKNHDYCIMYHWTQCDYLAGGGSTDLYKYENGKWIFIKSYMIGMS